MTAWKPRLEGKVFLVVMACVTALGCGLPAVVGSALVLTLLTQAAINGVLATGVGILARQNGLVSFGHSAFFGLAAYVIAVSVKHQWMSAETAIVCAVALPVVFAFALGLVITRIGGVAFSMLTLAVTQAFYELVVKWRELANGDDGLAVELPARVFGVRTAVYQQPASMFVICWLALMLLVTCLWLAVRGHFGTLTVAIRENEERARFIGFETLVPRAAVYAASAGIAAIGGVLFALYNGFVSPDSLHWSLSGAALVMAIIGGTTVVWGPAVGAMIFFLFKDAAGDLTEHWPAVIGGTLILVTVLMPKGVSGALLALAGRIGRRGEA